MKFLSEVPPVRATDSKAAPETGAAVIYSDTSPGDVFLLTAFSRRSQKWG